MKSNPHNFIVSFQENVMGNIETLYASELIAPEEDGDEWDVGTTEHKPSALTMTADLAAFIADIFDGEVEEK